MKGKHTMKHFYALFAPYGIRTTYNAHHWPTLHIFTTRADRDEWTKDDPNATREAITAAEARKYSDPQRNIYHPEKKKYFCDECGARFTAKPPKPTNFLPPRVSCPVCGCYCTHEDTNRGRAESVRDLTEYENETERAARGGKR